MMIHDLEPRHAGPNGTKRPIGFPTASGVDVLCKTRAGVENSVWQRQQERLGAALHAASAEGRALGERTGYRLGVRWGLICGAIAGCLGMASAGLGYALLQSLMGA